MGCIQSKTTEHTEISVHGIPHAIECKETRISKHIVLWNQYLVIRFLGSGASGQVFLCMDIKTQSLVAIKCICKGNGTSVPMEAQHLQVLKDAANIVPLRGILYNVASSNTMIVMEYYGGGPVFDRKQMSLRHPVPEDVARWYMRDIARGVMTLHAHGIIHGDLKLENMLISCKGFIGLIDLGSSKEFNGDDDTISSRKGGTPAFQAPEILLQKGPYSGKAADVYALGTCLYILLFSKTPYEADGISDLLHLMKQNGLDIPRHPWVSEEARSLVKGLLEKNPQKRMTLEEVSKHDWMTDTGRLEPVCMEQKDACAEVCNVHDAFGAQSNSMAYAKGDRICVQGERTNGCIGIVLEGTVDIVSRGTVQDDTCRPSFSGELHVSNGGEWVHVGSHDGSTSSSSAYDAQRDDSIRAEVRNLETEIDMALEKLEQIRFAGSMRGCQEEYVVERNATLLGEAVFQPCIVPSTSHAYSAIASSKRTKVVWISSESFHKAMSSNASLHRTISLVRCRRRSTLDTIAGLCLVRDMIM